MLKEKIKGDLHMGRALFHTSSLSLSSFDFMLDGLLFFFFFKPSFLPSVLVFFFFLLLLFSRSVHTSVTNMAPIIRSTYTPPIDDRGGRLLVMYWTECSIAIIVVSLRFYCRIKIKGVGLDDWTMLLTLVKEEKKKKKNFLYLPPPAPTCISKFSHI